MGALLKNVLLTLHQRDREPSYQIAGRVDPDRPVVTIQWKPTAEPRPDPTLYRMIPVRQTSRLPYDLHRSPRRTWKLFNPSWTLPVS